MRPPIAPSRIAPSLSVALSLLLAACSDNTAAPGGLGGSGTTGGNTASGGTGVASGGTGVASGGTGVASGGTGVASGGSTSSGGSTASGGGGSSGGSVASGGGGTGAGGAGGGTAGAGGGVSLPDGVVVNLAATHQTIQGFGINTALSSSTIPIDKLFSTTGPDGIGLSILRVGMNSGGSLTGTGVAEAKAKGAKIIGSCWSPKGSCKSNGIEEKGGALLESCYDSWATTIANFAKQQGLYAMSIANESDFASCKDKGPPCTDDYATTVFTANQMVKWVTAAAKKIRDISPDTKIIAPEASEWIHAWSTLSATGSEVSGHPQSSDPLGCGCFSNDPNDAAALAKCKAGCLTGDGYDYGHWLWKDQTAWKSFDIFGVHEYDSQIAFAWPSDVNGGKRDKEIWQTEMSGVRYWPEQGPSTDIKNGVAVAGWIHSALTVGEASAWLWWWYESYFQNDNEGLAIVQNSSTTAMRYYTMGNYSKFVRPGFTAVEVVGNANKDLLLSGYKGPAGEVVVVAVNKGSAEVTIPISIAGGTAPTMLTPTLTAASSKLIDGTAVPVTSGAFMAKLPSMSVTTFSGK